MISTSTKDMLKSLKSGMKQMEKNKKILKQISNDQIEQLPEEMRGQAVDLMNKAEKGKLDLSELMNFASSISDEDREKMRQNAAEVIEKVKKAKEEMEKNKADLSNSDKKKKVKETPKKK